MSIEQHRGPHDVSRQGDVAMRTRDGVTLMADVYRPSSAGPWPVLLRRTPYGKRVNDLAADFNEAHFFASHGYLVVVQDTRGRFASEGVWYPLIYEGRDGYDAVEWAGTLPNTTGKVGTFGQSYGCIIQYLTAALRPPHLAACIPTSGNMMSFENYWYDRGVLELGWMLSYFVNMAEETYRKQGRADELVKLDELKADPSVRFSPLREDQLRHLPISDWIARLGDAAPFIEDVIYHSVDGPYWWANDLRRQLHNIDVPMLHVGSWYDSNNWDTPILYNGLRERALGERARANQALFMGPWAHLLPYNQPTSGGTGDIDFGPKAAVFLLDMALDWFDRYVKGDAQSLARPAVQIFVMGENRWRDESEWPLARTQFVPYYFHSAGGANTTGGDGWLSTDAPGDEPPDTYRYDPDDPAPTIGGHSVGGGVYDQRPKQHRPDVLVYTSEVLEHDLELTGPVTVSLWASTSALDADFIVQLCDVRPDGYSQNLVEHIVRGSFRDSLTNPTPMVPGEVYELSLDLWNLSHVLFAGHRLRVTVTSSDFPRWERNLGTAERLGRGTAMRVADQTVYHDRLRPSHIVLPVIP